MAQPNSALSPPPDLGPEPVRDDIVPADVVQLLGRAAQLAAERGLASERFMQAAWAAWLDARPGLREEIEDKELRAQLKKLRKRGMVGRA